MSYQEMLKMNITRLQRLDELFTKDGNIGNAVIAGNMAKDLQQLQLFIEAKDQEIVRLKKQVEIESQMGALADRRFQQEVDEHYHDNFAKDQEIDRLNSALINKGVEIAELKEQLANQGSCPSDCEHIAGGNIYCCNCRRCPTITDYYTPKESK